MNNIGIYKIQNNVNGKIYIGSSKNMKTRKSQHFSELKNGYHVNPFLQHSWNKYGKDSFSFSIIENCKEKDLLIREQFYIDKYYDNQQKCFNLNPKATKPPVKMIETFLYDKDGNFYKAFDSIRNCAKFLGVHETSVGRIAKEKCYCKCQGYFVRHYKCQKIQIEQKNIFYIKNQSSTKSFNQYKDLLKFFNIKSDLEKSKINQAIKMGFRYQGCYIFKNNITEIASRSNLNVCKYILHFDKKGNLQNIIENNYGSKIDPKINNNTKYNDKIFRGQLNLPFRFSKKFQGIFIHSNTTVKKIKTNIKVYLIKNSKGDVEHEFDTLKSVIDFLHLKKSFISYHLSKYNFLKIENGKYLEKFIY